MDTTAASGLDELLAEWAGPDAGRLAVVEVLRTLAGTAAELGSLIARGESLVGQPIDDAAHEIFVRALRAAPVFSILSEQAPDPISVDPAALLAVALDPLNGSANVATNAPAGTTFVVFPANGAGALDPFRQPGRRAVAAGYVLYGPAMLLALTVGEGTHLFAFDRDRGRFVLRHRALQIPPGTREVAIDTSNRRHWEPALRTYVDELLAGSEGPRGGDFSLSWMAAPVAEAHRILLRGGLYLSPADHRPGHRQGRLHRVYEAFPIAMLLEQAGGDATDGQERVLDTAAAEPHERTPLVCGSADKVNRLSEFVRTTLRGEYSPLFRQRGLFRS